MRPHQSKHSKSVVKVHGTVVPFCAFGSEVVVGAAPGKYKVVVSRMVCPDGTPMPPDSQEPPIMGGAREDIALQDSGFSTTVRTANVASTGGTFDFALKAGGAAGIP